MLHFYILASGSLPFDEIRSRETDHVHPKSPGVRSTTATVQGSKKAAKSWGHTFIAIQPDMLVDDFRDKSQSIINTVRASGADIRIPGERSAIIAKERVESGVLPIPEKIWESICNTAKNGLS